MSIDIPADFETLLRRVLHEEIRPIMRSEIRPLLRDEILPMMRKEIRPMIREEIRPIVHEQTQSLRDDMRLIVHEETQDIRDEVRLIRQVQQSQSLQLHSLQVDTRGLKNVVRTYSILLEDLESRFSGYNEAFGV